MTKSSPKVVLRHRFYLAKNNPDNTKYFNDKKLMKKVFGMFDYYGNVRKKALFLLDYYRGDFKKKELMNIVFENGKYATNLEVEKRKLEYAKYIENSNLYQFIVSFNNNYIEEHCSLQELEQKMVKDIIPRFIKECGFKDIKNMSYQISCHTDSKSGHWHYHFSFVEKKPNFCNSQGSVDYRRKGKFTNRELNFLKMQTALSIEREKAIKPMTIELNKEIDNLKTYFNKDTKNFILKDKYDLILEDKLLELGKLLYIKRKEENKTSGKIKYNSIRDKEIKNLTNEIKKHLFKNKNSEVYMQKEKFDFAIKQINDYFQKLKKDNHIKKTETKKEDFVIQKEDSINNYIFNAIVNQAKNTYFDNYKNKISANDIIQEAVYKNYSNNQKNNRYNILKNYLANPTNSSKKFVSKYMIEKAVKNLNYEMDQAAEMFAELFANNNYLDK